MNLLFILAVAIAALDSPLAELQWQAYLESVSEQVGALEPIRPDPGGLRLEHRSIGPIERTLVIGEALARPVKLAYRLERRWSGAADGAVGSASLAWTARLGRMVVGLGPVRGGLGSGLLVWAGRWGGQIGFSTAWSGLPPLLRVAPSSPSIEVPTGLTADLGARRRLTVVAIRLPGRAWLAAAGWSPAREVSTVVATWPGGGGIETTVGSRGERLGWRFSGAIWNASAQRWRGTGEIRLSGGAREARWSFRVWQGGGRPPGAPGVWRGSTTYRQGYAMGIRLRPGRSTALEATVERGMSDWRSAQRTRWGEQLLLTVGLRKVGRIQVRLREKGEEKAAPWSGRERIGSRTFSLRLESSASGMVHRQGELKVTRDITRGRSLGFRSELSVVRRKWRIWAGLTRSIISTGVPLYWYERVPVGSWGMRAARESGTRVTLGVSTRPEGWHFQLVVVAGRQIGLLAGWRPTASASGRQ